MPRLIISASVLLTLSCLQNHSTCSRSGRSGYQFATHSKVSISLIPKAYPSGGEKSRETKLSDGDGRVIFQEQHERCTEVLMIHGWEEYFWRLCIQKSGFQSQLADLKANALSNGKIVINLTAGQSISCESSWQ